MEKIHIQNSGLQLGIWTHHYSKSVWCMRHTYRDDKKIEFEELEL